MDEHVLNRRRVLLGTGAVAIGGVAAASSASANGDSGPSGSWVISRKDDPPGDTTTVTTVVSFAAGSVLISQDISPADSPFTGTWARRGGGGFQGTMWVGQPGPAGPGKPGLTGTWQVYGRGRVGDLPVLRLRPLRRRRHPRHRLVHRPPHRGVSELGHSPTWKTTGAWSDAPLPLRSSRSMAAPTTREARAGEHSAKSMRMPWRFGKRSCV